MHCVCGGTLVKGKSSYRQSMDNFCIILDNIIAYKCNRCDKILFDEDTVEKIQKLINRIERVSNEIVTGMPSLKSYDYK